MAEKQSLLEYLQVAGECEYLSDIPKKVANHDVRLREAVASLSPESYSLREWNDALNYLSCESLCAGAQSNVADARMCLLSCLSES